jgi:hypothetical protein
MNGKGRPESRPSDAGVGLISISVMACPEGRGMPSTCARADQCTDFSVTLFVGVMIIEHEIGLIPGTRLCGWEARADGQGNPRPICLRWNLSLN